MSRGINIAENYRYRSLNYSNNSKPVVFLSHKSEDKEYVEELGNYLRNAGIDIYLDKNDPVLQRADREGDAQKVTECIEEGILRSDYILCIVSQKTVSSWWVPFEIGYGKKSEKPIASVIKNDITKVPDYLKIEDVILSIEDMNNYIKEITRKHNMVLFESTSTVPQNSGEFITKASYNNKLAKYLRVR
ncbi:toll/interleukin-1 receptor domain-containing protein [Clostridium sp. SM-530-WT-3G]|uniref:toll/interleukin-1 receptor domain-containing protein n=1 Tax=Clostridium sp. SM-530-WT-3G TaxID=2725303 RepID=UPI00145C5395|nr:toll/interleukin-1 receptor domain-containing protein [Clostridium sp. SM-530-WT-3G]NME81853.1 toll/interleukin-1 receptor domain-containing protein [Clostridium sp. SM-530-WT-3G]